MSYATNETGQQMRYTEEEINLIKSTFKDNEKLLKLLRKTFLPEYDPQAPLGQTVDLWMTVPPSELTPEYAYVNWKARNNLIAHVEQQLMQLDFLSKMQEKPKAKAGNDSTK